MIIELLGTSFNVRTDEDPEYFREVVAHFRSKVEEIQQSVSTTDPLKIAILAGILAADEYMKLTGSRRSEDLRAREITETLISELAGVLDPGPDEGSGL
ncbi:MAG: cell division protein ZapA [Spirochaetota bacterium]